MAKSSWSPGRAKLTFVSAFGGTPSDDLPDVLAAGRSDVTTAFVSLSARHPDGDDADYLAWHALDHRPEMHRLAGLRAASRVVSTPACRAARAASEGPYDGVDHVATYLFAGASSLGGFRALAGALHAGGRMPLGLPSVAAATYEFAGKVAAPRVGAGADVLPWRPARGAYLLLEGAAPSPAPLADVPGVAGVWWYRARPDDGAPTQLSYCYLDDDPVATADRLRDVLDRRWSDGQGEPRLAAPFHTVVPYEWDRHLPGNPRP